MTRRSIPLAVAALSLALLSSSLSAAETAAPAPPPKLKQYVFGMLRKGPHRDQDEATAQKIQAGHIAHLEKCGKEGKLLIAGPFGDDGDWRGILIYDVPTVDDARKLCDADPAVASGRLVCELHPWWAMPGAALK